MSYSKVEFRKWGEARRGTLSEEERRDFSQRIADRVCSCPSYMEAKALAVYFSRGEEVDSSLMIRRAMSEGKKVFLPSCHKRPKMEFYPYREGDRLILSSYGIWEPEIQEERLWEEGIGLCQRTLFLLPGLVFHPSGGRIGYGGGFYDAYLGRIFREKQEDRGDFIGICYSCQLTKEALPLEEHDICVETIVTEEEMIQTKEMTSEKL